MKYLVIILFFIGCNTKNNDTSGAANTAPLSHCDSLNLTIDSLKKKLFVAKFKVERVQYYLDIVEKKPSQQKFLRGWIKRAVEE
jgi:hypothetical protein